MDVEGMDVEEVDVEEMDVEEMDVEGVDVEEVDVEEMDVEGVDVEEVDVEEVDVEEVDVEEMDVEGVDVEEVDVEEVDVEGVDVEEVDVEEVDVEEMDVEGVDVEEVDVEEVDVEEVDVEEMDVEEMDVEEMDVEGVDVEEVDVEEMDVEEVDVEEVDVEEVEVDVEEVDVEEMDVEEVDVEEVDVEEVDVEGMDVEGMDVEEVDVEEVEGMDVEEVDVEVMDVEEMDVEGMDVEEVDVEGVDVEGMDVEEVEEVDVEGMDVEGMDVEGMDVEEVDVEEVEGVDVEEVDVEVMDVEEVEGMDVEGMDVEEVDVEEVDVEEVDVEEVEVEGMDVEEVDVEGVEVEGVDVEGWMWMEVEGMDVEEVDVEEVDVEEVDVEEVDVEGMDVEGMDVEEVDVEGVDVEEVEGVDVEEVEEVDGFLWVCFCREFLFLLWGVYLCYAVRTVPSAFHEPRYMTAAIHNELLISAIFHTIRFTLAPLWHPDWMLMLVFSHTHLTVTVTLGLLLVPKFLSTGTQARDDIATEVYEEELDMGRSGSYLNSSITSAWSEHSLDPEDIRDELKKLYAQLEVYKRKKMLANNPHLQKKRSSKKGLGRSLMRRITEIPDSMHRHGSREDRDGSEHGSNRSTLRRNPFDPSHTVHKPREDSLKNKVLALKKSHSYDHVCDPGQEAPGVVGAGGDKMTAGEGSLLGSLMRRQVKRSPEPAPKVDQVESTESVPLVCKSASAHNFPVEKKPVHLRTSIMQKSLSVITSAKEKMPGHNSKTQSAEDAGKQANKAPEGRNLSEVNETDEMSCYPKMIISQSVEYSKTPMGKMGIMKQQVSGSQPSINTEPTRNLYDLSEVCPWDVEEPTTPLEGKAQKHVSIAPGETTTVHGSVGTGSAKGCRTQQKPQKATGQSPKGRRRSRDTAAEQDEARETRKPRSPRSSLTLKPEGCPWAFEEQPVLGGDSDSISPERMRRKKSVTPTDGKPKVLHSDYSKSTGSLLQPPTLMVDICPWDYNEAPSLPSPVHGTCSSPTSHSKRKRKGSCSSKDKGERSEREKAGRNREEEKPQGSKSKERRSSSSRASEKRRVSQTSEGCPVAVVSSGRRRSSTRYPEASENKRAEACPLEAEGPPTSLVQTKTSPVKENHLSTDFKQPVSTANKVDVCPWDYEDSGLEKTA
ncbi:hypothetical protein DPEC_G00055220 [Dallia pectoralis]|uniref:Uncharacterized protein n=1 Tax=Dallia pectoralis TaxID=75939 RepID=A0ACC2H6J5_DALPE|nr:hypothetical protein DPEC_G00055220 [Dallia pectoralis]